MIQMLDEAMNPKSAFEICSHRWAASHHHEKLQFWESPNQFKNGKPSAKKQDFGILKLKMTYLFEIWECEEIGFETLLNRHPFRACFQPVHTMQNIVTFWRLKKCWKNEMRHSPSISGTLTNFSRKIELQKIKYSCTIQSWGTEFCSCFYSLICLRVFRLKGCTVPFSNSVMFSTAGWSYRLHSIFGATEIGFIVPSKAWVFVYFSIKRLTIIRVTAETGNALASLIMILGLLWLCKKFQELC